MSVLNRKLFNRGGPVSSRGVGITSGLATPRRGYVDRPGSYAGKEDAESSLPTAPTFEARSFEDVFAERQALLEKLRPPKQEFNKLENAAPALMTFFGNLMSGKSFQSGLSGALDITGNAVAQATPEFSQALARKNKAEADDRAEKFALDLQAFESAETAHAAELKREADLLETKYKKDVFKVTGDDGRVMNQERVSYDNGFTWYDVGPSWPANEDTFVTGSQGIYENKDGETILGYQVIVDGKLVTKSQDGNEIGGYKKQEFTLGDNVYGVINSNDGSFTGLQIDMKTKDGLEIYKKIMGQKEGDTVLIAGKEVPVSQLSVTKENPEFEKEPELGENVYTVYDRNGKATGEQVDLAAEGGPERYKELLADTNFTLAKVSINAADADSLNSMDVGKSYNKDLMVSMDAQVLFVQDLLPAYMMTQQPDCIAQDTLVGTGFRWINNIKANIDNFAKLYIQDPENNDPIFVDAMGKGMQVDADQFLASFMGSSESNRDLVEAVAGKGEMFNAQIIGLAYSLAKSNNPDGRISEPDFRYALMELKGRTADPDIIGDIMLLQYGKAKNRYIQAWINQARIDGIPKVVNGKTWVDQAEEEWLARSEESQIFETQIAENDKKDNTNKTDIIATEARSVELPLTWDDNGEEKLLIQDGKPAMMFIGQWLNSPSPVEGLTWGEFVSENGFVLSYIDEEGNKKLLSISEKK